MPIKVNQAMKQEFYDSAKSDETSNAVSARSSGFVSFNENISFKEPLKVYS